ncbi:hypothetical protein DBO86_10540 [Pseudomonas indoloxydans]|uniref:Uncharacterized protein n=1 Tax=Ectopseudomonas oleovorans TaxID=301 RepID=A0A2T5PMW9_ECTOL|nr:hypothetical protein [Pseudomonas indoloxydans]PTU79108.1 hypothetical protein DBO86_10540 [Pseudomonas indoloxydans]
MQELFECFIKPDKILTREAITHEARMTYWGHLEATIYQFHSMHSAAELDAILQGEPTIVATAQACYDYAINGVLRPATSDVEAESISHDWKALASLIRAARYGIEFFSPEVDSEDVGVPDQLEQLMFHAMLRARLDLATIPNLDEDVLPSPLRPATSHKLNLKEIGVLARMEEKSVRNATQPKAPDRLQTCKEGTRTVVEFHEALRWLKGRRHFKPTVLV